MSLNYLGKQVNRNLGVCASLGLLIASGLPSIAVAEGSGFATLEEVTVTARKREENLQDAPVAVTAFTSAAIEARGLSDISQINGSVPNLQFSSTASVSGSSSAASVFIRGVGQTDFTLTTEPGVGVFLDGVYIARSVGSVLNVLDVERVEVLRGPQGTLFGKNTIGGAINVTSKRPAEEFQGKLEVTAGRYNRLDTKLAMDIPINEKLLTKFSLGSLNKDGHVDRLLVGDELGGKDELVGKASALYLPSDELSVYLSFDSSKVRSNSAGSKLLGVNLNPGAPFLPLLNASLPPQQQYTLGNYGTSGLYTTNGTGPNVNDIDIWGVSAIVEWTPDAFTLKSITAYRDLDGHFGRDGDNSPLLLAHTEDFYEQEQFSQEFQLSGVGFDDRLEWLVGAFYFSEKGDNVNLVSFAGQFGGLFGLSSPAFTLQSGGEIDNYSAGGFAQVTYDLNDQWALTGGLRYSYEKREFLPDQYVREIRSAGLSNVIPGFDPILPFEWVADSTSRWDPKVGIEYQVVSDVLLYATYSTGFKGGGFGQRVFPGRSDTPTFGPEIVKVYELGAKVTAFDNRVRLNMAVFHTDYEDMQVTVFDGIAPRTVNGGNAEVDGFEIELDAVPLERLLVGLGIGYTNARFKDVSPGATEVTVNSEFPYTPEWTVNGFFAYEFELESFGLLTIRSDWSYRTEQYLDAANGLFQDEYELVDVSLMYEPNGENWSFMAGVRNVTGTEYLTGGLDSLNAFGYAEGIYAPRQEWFVTARYQF